MIRLRHSVAIALAAAVSLSSLPVSAADSVTPRSITPRSVTPRSGSTPSCDVLVTRDGTWDGLYKIATDGTTSEVKLGDFPIDVVTSSDGRTAYVAGHGTGELFVVDVVNMRKLATIDTEEAPIDLAISADDGTVYVAATGGVHVIDSATRRQSRFIELDSSPFAIELSPDGTRLYAFLVYDDDMVVVDLVSDVRRTVPIPVSAESSAITPDGRYVFVTHRTIDKVSRIRTSDLRVDTVSAGDAPRGIAMSPNGSTIYVVNQDAHTVSVIDTQSLASSSTIAVGDGAYDVMFDDDGKRAYVNNYWEDSMSIIDTTTRTVIGSLPLGTVNASWGIDTACRATAAAARPRMIDNFFVFANFFCGPCTNAWILFTRPADTTDFSVFVDGRRTTCAQKGYFFDLALCELTGLTPGSPTTFSVIPANGSTSGSTAATSLTLRR